MCGILAVLEIDQDAEQKRKQALTLVKRLRHRGPDWSGIYSDSSVVLAHERLAIVDVEHGAQPLQSADSGCVLAVNGEIYNHRALRHDLAGTHTFQTQSDCEVILYLYEEMGAEFLNQLNGIYAFVLYDPGRQTYLIARDPIGVVPLYMGRDEEGCLYVASEMKAIEDVCTKVAEFPPGHYFYGHEKTLKKYYQPRWQRQQNVDGTTLDLDKLRDSLEQAVKRQLMCDVPYGLLISGGVDSSLIAAIATKYKNRRVEANGDEPAWWPQLHSFSIGLDGSPDLEAAQKVAAHIGTVHHAITFTVQQGLDAISDVIYHLETFDVTTVRAATPMYLMARQIKAMGIKMVLSGEGADEIFGGYLYFHKAPNAAEFYQETLRKISQLHLYDCLRANKATAAWGVETRVPFLDREFLDVAMAIDPADKMIRDGKMEKHILRQAFAGYLPDEILWRQKEQFSDGVGYSWIDSLREVADFEVTDKMMEKAAHRFPVKTPLSKEEYRYRRIFEEHFKNPSALECVPVGPSIACSTPTAIRWDKSFADAADPSGRSVANVHLHQVTA